MGNRLGIGLVCVVGRFVFTLPLPLVAPVDSVHGVAVLLMRFAAEFASGASPDDLTAAGMGLQGHVARIFPGFGCNLRTGSPVLPLAAVAAGHIGTGTEVA
jgi:hypothetical protein